MKTIGFVSIEETRTNIGGELYYGEEYVWDTDISDSCQSLHVYHSVRDAIKDAWGNGFSVFKVSVKLVKNKTFSHIEWEKLDKVEFNMNVEYDEMIKNLPKSNKDVKFEGI